MSRIHVEPMTGGLEVGGDDIGGRRCFGRRLSVGVKARNVLWGAIRWVDVLPK